MALSRIKETGSGTLHGYIFMSEDKVILQDCSGPGCVQLVIFQNTPIKPLCMYEVSCTKLVLDSRCIPIHPGNIKVVLDNNSVTFRSTPCQYGVYVQERYNVIKKDMFHVTVCIADRSSREVYERIVFFESDWFLYLIPENFYLIESKYKIISSEQNDVINSKLWDDGTFTINHISPENNDHDVIKFLRTKVATKSKEFTTFDAINTSNSYVNLDVQIINTDSYINTGFVSFVDLKDNIRKICLSPAIPKLPATFISGTRLKLTNIDVKRTSKQLTVLSLTCLTNITLISLPSETKADISDLYQIYQNKTTGLVNLLISVDCILSLSVTPGFTVLCNLAVTDNTGTATLHIRDNNVFVQTLFRLTEEECSSLQHVNASFGKIDCYTTERIPAMFSRIMFSENKWFVRGKVKHDTTPFMIQTPYGKTFKHPRTHIFPYLIRTLSPTQQLQYLS